MRIVAGRTHVVALAAMLWASASAAEVHRFVQLTDTHISSSQTRDDLRQVLRAIRLLQPKPEFLLVSGDLTDIGSRQEWVDFRTIMDSCGIPYYCLAGNHDSRWTGLNSAQIEQILGQPRSFSFLWHGIEIIGLDSALPLEAWGDIEEGEIRRLAAESAGGRPCILTTHHPLRYPVSNYLSDRPDLFSCLDSLHVALCLVGHGHFFSRWWADDVPMVMGPAVMRRQGFIIVTLDGDSLRLQVRTGSSATAEQCWSLPLRPARLGCFYLDGPKAGSGVWQWQILTKGVLQGPDPRWEFQRNSGPWMPLSATASGSWTLSDSTQLWPEGVNVLTARACMDSEKYYFRSSTFIQENRTVSVLWRENLGGRIQAPLIASGSRLFAATGEGKILALDQRSGRIIWQQRLPGAIVKGLTHGDDRLFAATMDGEVACLAAQSGEIIWRVQIAAAVAAAPRYDHGFLYIGAGEGGLFRLAANSGRVTWQFPLDLLIQQQPLVAHDRVYFGCWDRTFYALEAASGREVWKKKFSDSPIFSPATASPAIAGDCVIFIRAAPRPGAASVYACHVDTGDTLWTYPVSSHYCPPLVWRDRVLIGGIEGVFYALDWHTGRLLWRVTTGEELFDSKPVLMDGVIYWSTVKGSLFAIDPRSGRVRGRYQAGDGLSFAPLAAAHQTVFAAEVDGFVTALKLR